jgi:RF-1 domain
MDRAGQDQDRLATSGHPAAIDPVVLATQCEFRATRRHGPGGQNRNKLETAVVLTHRPTGISAQASERRTQGENRRTALHRLRLELALTVRRPIRFSGEQSYAASALWLKRCRAGRIDVSTQHDDFPALLAEALDVLFASDDEPRTAARLLSCSPTQLIRFLHDAPRALVLINERRRAAGRHPLQ